MNSRYRKLVWVTLNQEEAAATRPLCYSTTRIQYWGASNAEITEQEVLLAKCSTKSVVERKVTGSSLKEDVASFPSLFNVNNDLCQVPFLVCWCSMVVMWQLAID